MNKKPGPSNTRKSEVVATNFPLRKGGSKGRRMTLKSLSAGSDHFDALIRRDHPEFGR